jgi:hypothetical protein
MNATIQHHTRHVYTMVHTHNTNPVDPVFPPAPPRTTYRTRWPVPKPTWRINFGDYDFIVVVADNVVASPQVSRYAIADGVEIRVRRPITSIVRHDDFQ